MFNIYRRFPYSNFHEFNLDQIIEIVVELAKDWVDYNTKWEKLYDDTQKALTDFIEYANNYFATLDLTSEVTTVLNKMVSDGTILNIIRPSIVDTTNNWLAQHVTPSTEVVLDESLSIHNACAESSATGRAIRASLSSIIEREGKYIIAPDDCVANQYWNTGTGAHVYSNNNRFISTPHMLYFPIKAGQPIFSKITDGYYFNIVFYDADMNYVGTSEGTNVGWFNQDAEFIAINFRRADNSDIAGANFTFEISNLVTNIEIPSKSTTLFDNLHYGKYYNTDNSHIMANVNFAITDIYRVPSDGMFMSSLTSKLAGVFWDKDFNFLGMAMIRGRTHGDYTRLKVIPEGAYYMGITVYKPDGAYIESITDFTLYHSESSNIVFGDNEPDNYNNYYVMDNCFIDSAGMVVSRDLYNCAILTNCNFDTIYAESDTQLSIVYIDRDNNVIDAEPPYVQDQHYGRRYERPSDAYTTAVLFKKSLTIDGTNKLGQYFACTYDDNIVHTLIGTRTLCIGDSITWLDNTEGVASGTRMLEGYQKQIRRAGSMVDSIAVNGGAYTVGYGDGSIHTAVQNFEGDFSDYDNIILFGGLNDMRTNAPIGEVGETYQTPNTTPTNFIGAIGDIIDIIRTVNPSANIIICTPLPTNEVNRNYPKLKTYRDAIINTALYWGVEVLDMSSKSRRDIATNPNGLTYDGTHPTNKGMEIIGKIIVGTLITDYYMP